ncbi:MAG: response regulator transcription factor [Syntrophothermus sp.]
MKKDFDFIRSEMQFSRQVGLFILEDKPMVKDGLRQWLKTDTHYRIKHCSLNWEEIKVAMKEDENAILITSVKFVKEILKDLAGLMNIKVVCFCENTFDIQSENIFNSNILGIMNYTVEKSEFLNGLRNVSEGKLFISTRIMQSAYSEGIFSSTLSEPGNLTRREQEVVTLISLGYSDKEIGEILHLSKRTIDGYRNNLLVKFNARNSAHLIRFAINQHMILPDEEMKNLVF